jgi:hypothetical protein
VAGVSAGAADWLSTNALGKCSRIMALLIFRYDVRCERDGPVGSREISLDGGNHTL